MLFMILLNIFEVEYSIVLSQLLTFKAEKIRLLEIMLILAIMDSLLTNIVRNIIYKLDN
jgi:hypothetical protein